MLTEFLWTSTSPSPSLLPSVKLKANKYFRVKLIMPREKKTEKSFQVPLKYAAWVASVIASDASHAWCFNLFAFVHSVVFFTSHKIMWYCIRVHRKHILKISFFTSRLSFFISAKKHFATFIRTRKKIALKNCIRAIKPISGSRWNFIGFQVFSSSSLLLNKNQFQQI